MKNINILILIAGALLLCAYSCKQTEKAANLSPEEKTEMNQENKKTKEKNAIRIQNVIVDPTYVNKTTDEFKLLESSIRGDILSLLVQYGGGCKTHEWALKTDGNYAKSLPPQITLNIEHDAKGDMCRALFMDTIKFNIEKIKYPGTFQLQLKIKDYEKQTIIYNYN